MWRELRKELDLEIVLVALDSDPAAVRPYLPSLIDEGHAMDDALGIVNVPTGVWIDESGTIVRPPETAYPRRPPFLDSTPIPEVRGLQIDGDAYVAALRQWDRYALPPDEVRRRLRPRSMDEATAAAHFEMALHHHRAGNRDVAIAHFQEACRLQPANWTYKRQSWKFGAPGDWLTEVRKIGPENYYPPLDL